MLSKTPWPTNTPYFGPTFAPDPTRTPSPTPDVRLIDVAPDDFFVIDPAQPQPNEAIQLRWSVQDATTLQLVIRAGDDNYDGTRDYHTKGRKYTELPKAGILNMTIPPLSCADEYMFLLAYTEAGEQVYWVEQSIASIFIPVPQREWRFDVPPAFLEEHRITQFCPNSDELQAVTLTEQSFERGRMLKIDGRSSVIISWDKTVQTDEEWNRWNGQLLADTFDPAVDAPADRFARVWEESEMARERLGNPIADPVTYDGYFQSAPGGSKPTTGYTFISGQDGFAWFVRTASGGGSRVLKTTIPNP